MLKVRGVWRFCTVCVLISVSVEKRDFGHTLHTLKQKFISKSALSFAAVKASVVGGEDLGCGEEDDRFLVELRVSAVQVLKVNHRTTEGRSQPCVVELSRFIQTCK